MEGGRPRRRLFVNVARAIVSVAILVAVANRVDLGAVWAIELGAEPGWILLGVCVALGGRVFAGFRWYVLVHGRNPEARFGRIVRLVFTSSLFGMFMPGMLGVDMIRVYGLSKSTSDLALSLASVLVERLLAMIVLIILVLVGLLFAPTGLPAALAQVAWVGIIALLAGSVAILHPSTRAMGDWTLSVLRLTWVKERLQRVYEALDVYKEQHVIMAWSVAAAVGSVVFRIVPTVILASGLGLEISLVHFAVFLPLIHFVTQIPLSLGGLGVRETAFVAFFGLVGVPAEEAFTLSLMVYAVNVFSALPGAWFYVRGGFTADTGSAASRRAEMRKSEV